MEKNRLKFFVMGLCFLFLSTSLCHVMEADAQETVDEKSTFVIRIGPSLKEKNTNALRETLGLIEDEFLEIEIELSAEETEKILETLESLNKQLGYLVTSTLKPEPIDLDIKVILVGNSYLYSLLYTHEEDFRNLFKIMADFDIELNKNSENIYKTIHLISIKAKRKT